MDVSVKGYDKMGDAHGFDDRKDDGPADRVSRSVLFMRFIRADVEVDDVAIATPAGELYV